MKIQDITSFLESVAPPSLQESYDNAGLLTGEAQWECTGAITCLDATEAVVLEAIEKKCNLIIAHHPIIFSGLKKVNSSTYIGRSVITAIKNDIAIYSIHTNLDHVIDGVNGRMADRLGLINRRVLIPKRNILKKLVTYVPHSHAAQVRDAVVAAGAGEIGQYSECSFNSKGEGTFKANDGAKPFVGQVGLRHTEQETKIETIFLAWKEGEIRRALINAHPYEEVVYDIYPLENSEEQVGSGLLGELSVALDETAFLHLLKEQFELEVIRHTPFMGRTVKKIALCGGAGSFLIGAAIASGADFYVTGDVKYHEFFDANAKIVIADIGHYESEQFTQHLLVDILTEKFPNFAVQKTQVKTNPVNYFG
ncbi:MAG: Nif3-like dinuclear metal center hexameric protein [Bacteroidota bacterium]